MSRAISKPTEKKQVIRCAIYTRKSTEEGLQQDFNSLDAQREACEAYITSQKGNGWVCVATRYDDGGYTGANTDRPAFQRLLKDIEADLIDCVIVYKVDRLSRSLLDFLKVVQVFETHEVSFVSVTQHFDTSTSMGRLMLHILLSFAQFERETTAERTRDKMAAARRKGKYMGGKPILGYDLLISESGSKLVVNDDEAARVRAIFELYLQHQSLVPTVTELNKRGWRTKSWQTRKGKTSGGHRFDKCNLFGLLTNMLYIGKIRHHNEIHPGEHAGIVDEQVWQRVQATLQRNGRTGGVLARNKHGALLKGLLRCVPCNCAMSHSFTARGAKRYRYYTCVQAQKRGWHTCPTKSVPAGEIERFVVDQIKSIGKDPAVLAETLRQARDLSQRGLTQLQAEEQALQRELSRYHAELTTLVTAPSNGALAGALANLQDRIHLAEQRATQVREQIVALSREMVVEHEVQAALSVFDPVWETLRPPEQARIIHLLVERVDYDGGNGTVSVTFRPSGIKTLAQQLEEVAA